MYAWLLLLIVLLLLCDFLLLLLLLVLLLLSLLLLFHTRVMNGYPLPRLFLLLSPVPLGSTRTSMAASSSKAPVVPSPASTTLPTPSSAGSSGSGGGGKYKCGAVGTAFIKCPNNLCCSQYGASNSLSNTYFIGNPLVRGVPQT